MSVVTPADPAVEQVSPMRPIRTQGHAKVPTILQMEIMECGAACLAMVLANWKCWVALEELRTVCGVSRDGTSLLDVYHAGAKYGLKGHGHAGTANDLDGITVPTILWWEGNHFVVLEKARRNRIRINDPASGRRVITRSELEFSYSGRALSFEKTPDFHPQGHAPRVISTLKSRLSKSKSGVAFAFTAGLISVFLGLFLPLVAQVFIDQVLGENDKNLIPLLAGILFAVAVVMFALTQLQFAAIIRMQKKLELIGSWQFLERILRLPLEFFTQRRVGDLAQRADASARLAHMLGTHIAASLLNIAVVLAYGALMFYYSWKIAAAVLTLALLDVIALKILYAYRKGMEQRLGRDLGTWRGETVATLQTIETIKATGAADDAFDRWINSLDRVISTRQTAVTPTVLLGSIPVLVGSLMSAMILVFCGLEVMNGSLSMGAMVAIQTMAFGMIGPIVSLSQTAGELQLMGISLQRVQDVMANKLDPRFTTPAAVDAPKRIAGRLTLEDITFGYRRTKEPLIENFSLDIAPGARVALVGGSGSGKTTIANIAAGLFEPWTGRLLLDGRPFTDYPREALNTAVTKIDQSIILFEGTVRENVTFFDDTVSTERVRDALADACVLDEVLERPNGLEAHVEERGRNFSGGQRQRLEIARALALEPRVMILDEATSALDVATELRVDSALRARGITCLIVAHRLSTIRDADEILVLGKHGEVLERGSHQQLMADQTGEYFRLVTEAEGDGDVGD